VKTSDETHQRLPRSQERRHTSFIHSALAILVTVIFAVLCAIVFSIVVTASNLESWAAGMVGAVIGYWANNVTQIISYYYGASSGPNAAQLSYHPQSMPGRLIRGQDPPPNSIGAVGDYYHDENNKDTYGPKNLGAWGPPRDAIT
jgi:hypothetical protein